MTKYDHNLFQKNVKCHLHPVGHRIRCDEAAFQKNVKLALTSFWLCAMVFE